MSGGEGQHRLCLEERGGVRVGGHADVVVAEEHLRETWMYVARDVGERKRTCRCLHHITNRHKPTASEVSTVICPKRRPMHERSPRLKGEKAKWLTGV